MRPDHPTPLAALFTALVITVPLAAAEPAKPAKPPAVEVRYTDNSTMRLTLRDDRVEIDTRYGKLLIPAADVRRIEFATRVPADVTKRIEAAVANLGSPQYKLREAAAAELLGLREKAYPALQQAAKHADAEVARRAEELLDKLREEVPTEQLEPRPNDVVHTADMTVTGRIAAASLRVETFQFGEQSLKLSDVRSLRSLAVPDTESVAVEPKNVMADPGNLTALHNQIGKTFYVRVTGVLGGSVWGTDTYTSDSTLAAAAVHAGAVQAGQTAVVRVTIVAPLNAFQGSTRNGVTSMPFANFPGAYKVSK
jgi:LCCL domain